MVEAIYIPKLLKSREKTEIIEVSEYLSGLETLTPVQGKVKVAHKGNYLEVSGQAETIITLCCDLCLQQYNHRLKVKTSELIWLDEAADCSAAHLSLEREVAFADLVEVLPPQGYFDPGVWLYEQLCLEIPPQKRCDRACPGIELTESSQQAKLAVDKRWASLEALKKQLNG